MPSTTFTDTWVVSGQPARNYQVSAVNADGVESFLSGTVLSASVVPVTPDPRTTAVNQLTIVFNAPVTGFDLADLSLKKVLTLSVGAFRPSSALMIDSQLVIVAQQFNGENGAVFALGDWHSQ